MKLKTLSLICLCMATFSGCMSLPTGNGPDGQEKDLTSGVPTQKRDITFSVDYSSDMGPDSWFDEEEIILETRKQLTASGLFGRIHYVSLENAGPYHYHFKVVHTGSTPADCVGLGFLAGLTLTTIPVWTHGDLDWTMSYLVRGKEVHSVSSQQKVTDIIWAPFIIVSPFMNHGTMGSGMKKKPLWYFVRDIRQHNLNGVE